MTLNECVEKLNEMSIEDIKNLKKYEQIAELCKDFSKVNTAQSLQSIWEESLKQPTTMPQEMIFTNIPRGCGKSLFGDLTLREIDIGDREES